MTDIVERLRSYEKGALWDATGILRDIEQAADEIERLRAEFETHRRTVVSQIDEWNEANSVLADKRLAEIERLRETLQSIRDERADVLTNREDQFIAEIKRRGKELETVRASRDEVIAVASKRQDEIERLRAVLILIVEDEEAFPLPPEARRALLEALGRGVSSR